MGEKMIVKKIFAMTLEIYSALSKASKINYF